MSNANSSPSSCGSLQRKRRLMTAALVAAVCLGGVAWRFAPIGNAQQSSPSPVRSFALSYVPRDAVVVIAARPAALLQRPAMQGIRESLSQLPEDRPLWKVNPNSLAEFRAVALMDNDAEPSFAFLARAASREAAEKLAADFGESEPVRFGDHTYFHAQTAEFYFQPDELSFVVSRDEAALRRCLLAGQEGASNAAWADRWNAMDSDAAAVINTSLLRAIPALFRETRGQNRTDQVFYEAVRRAAPLWQKSESAMAGLDVGDEIVLRVVAQAPTEEDCRQVHDSLLTVISAARLSLSMGRASLASSDDPKLALYERLDLLDAVLEQARVVRQKTQVGVQASANASVAQRLASMLWPAALAGRDAASREVSSNNLKQLALAMHNYHDTYRAFPAATQIGPKETPRSWRVTVLPFLGEMELYNQYRQDEPWDSEANRKVLEKMPEVFRYPGDARRSTSTSYFALIGEGTPFAGAKNGRMASITDGTSNTIMLVESKQATPWTKPEDIPFDPRRPLPKLGGWTPGGFMSAFCDASVRFVPSDIDPTTLRHAIIRNDGNQLRWPR